MCLRHLSSFLKQMRRDTSIVGLVYSCLESGFKENSDVLILMYTIKNIRYFFLIYEIWLFSDRCLNYLQRKLVKENFFSSLQNLDFLKKIVAHCKHENYWIRYEVKEFIRALLQFYSPAEFYIYFAEEVSRCLGENLEILNEQVLDLIYENMKIEKKDLK